MNKLQPVAQLSYPHNPHAQHLYMHTACRSIALWGVLRKWILSNIKYVCLQCFKEMLQEMSIIKTFETSEWDPLLTNEFTGLGLKTKRAFKQVLPRSK